MIPAACTIRREMPAAVNKFNWIKTANMRKITTSALLFLLLFKLHAQPINNIRVTLPRQLPANTAEWASLAQPIIISAQAKPVQGRIPPEVMESRVIVTIENSAGKICGAHNQSNAPMSNFTSAIKTWTGAQAVGLLGQECTLRSGEYQFCVEFYGMNMATGAIAAISEKKCFPFTITGNEEYSPPTLINPENGKQYTEAELMRPVTFRWTPLVPKPQEPVTYRLRVWQLMQGQNGTSAMRSSEPIITRDVSNVTQAVVNAVLTGPCKPPYLCDFVWNVQAISRDGKPMGNNNGTSEPYQFKATTANTQINPPALTAPLNNSSLSLNDAMKSIRFQWKSVDPKPQEPVTYRLRVWQLMQGQTGASAMRTQPLVTKEVSNATEVAVNSLLTGPCKPPYLCDFVWNVQAIARNGQPVGSNEGTSETWAFSVANCEYNFRLKVTSTKCVGTQNGNNIYNICISSYYASASLNLTYSGAGSGISVTHPSYSPSYAVSGITPGLTPQNAGPGTTMNYCFTLTVPIGQTSVIVGLQGDDANPNPNITCRPGADTTIKLPACPCDPCKTLGVTVKEDKLTTVSSTSSQVILSGTLSGLNPSTVKKITMELVYYDIKQTGDSNCAKCADNAAWGNFVKPASYYFPGYNTGILNGVNFGREWTWISTVQKDCNSGGHDGDGIGGTGTPQGTVSQKCATCGTIGMEAGPKTELNIDTLRAVNISPPSQAPPNTFSLPIAVPPGGSLSCCGDKIKICIRYTVWDFCCHACDIIKCYEIERKAQ